MHPWFSPVLLHASVSVVGANPIQYYHKNSEYTKSLWDFGTGLSYTSFTYANLVVSPQMVAPGQNFTVSVDIANTGPLFGKQSVLVFVTDDYRIVTPEAKMLKRFDKVALSPGQQTTVQFVMTSDDLAFYGKMDCVFDSRSSLVSFQITK